MNVTLNQKLLTRTKTAIIFGAIVIALLSYSRLSNYIFLGLVLLLCSVEYYKLRKPMDQIQFNEWVSNLLIIPLILLPIFINADIETFWLVIFTSIYGVLSIIHLYFPLKYFSKKKWLINHYSTFVFGPLLLAIVMLSQEIPFNHFVLKVIILIWLCDSGAYLVGSRIGKTKLFPTISPNKTIEGSLGAGVVTILGGMIIAHYFGGGLYLYWLMLSIVVWIFGTYGDLVQSSLKRELDIKDTGTLMPGHGGFLDRFDSFIFVWPFIGLLHLFIQA